MGDMVKRMVAEEYVTGRSRNQKRVHKSDSFRSATKSAWIKGANGTIEKVPARKSNDFMIKVLRENSGQWTLTDAIL